jgi:PAS domain S-box-containing protein
MTDEGFSVFKAIVEACDAAVAVTTPDGRPVHINPAHENRFGRLMEGMKAAGIRVCFPPESLEIIDREVLPALKKGTVWEGILDARNADGSIFPVSLRAGTVRGEAGHPVYHFWIIHDARDRIGRKGIEEALRESEERYRTLFEENRNPIAVIDTRGRYLDANPAFLRLVEKRRDQLLRMNVFDFAPPGRKDQQERDHLPKWESGGTVETEYWIDGNPKTVELTITPIRYKGRDAVVGVGKEITERRRAEENLRFEHARFQVVIDSLDVGICAADMETQELLFMNAFARNTFGNRVGKKCWEVIQAGQTGPCPFCTNDQLVDADGQPTEPTTWEFQNTADKRWYQCRTQAVPWPDGRMVRLEIATDITELKRVEAALRESREQLRDTYRLAQIGVWSWDPAEDRVVWSQELYQIAGRDPHHPAPTYAAHHQVYTPESWARLNDAVERTLATGDPYELELEMVRPDGSTRWVSAFGGSTCGEDGKIERLYGTVQDITRRKEAEANLIASKEQLMEAQRLAGIGHWTWHVESQILTWSDEVYRIAGVEKKTFVPTIESFEAIVFPDDREPCRRRREEMLNTQLPLDFEHRIMRPSGETRTVRERTRVLSDQGGRVGRILGVIQDITDQKRYEAEKARLSSRKQQLQKAESLARMAGAIAHNFNNLFFTILGNLEMALEEVPSTSPGHDYIETALRTIHQASEMSGLMQSYLGQRPGNARPVDLAELCRERLPLLRSTFPKGMALAADLPAAGPVVRVDPGDMAQVLTHLITNAREAMETAGGTVHVTVSRVAATAIPVENRFPLKWSPSEGDHGCLTVSDSGPGIRRDHLDQIFDPFFTTRFTGRGLGLAIVLGVVRRYNGGVVVESRPDLRTTFRVLLPVSEEPALPKEEKRAAEPVQETDGLILVVDDEEMVRSVAAEMLKRIGWQVLTAADGHGAVETFRAHRDRIDMVLLDLSMPGMNGWEALAAIRSIHPDVPAILASGYDEAHVMSGDHTEHPHAFLKKPYTRNELSAVVNRIMDAHGRSGK